METKPLRLRRGRYRLRLHSSINTPSAWLMTVRILLRFLVPFLEWVTSAKGYWVTLALLSVEDP